MNNSPTAQSRFQDVAYVLHGRAYQNTSMIVDVFTREYGRLSLLAKGAKRPASALYGVLQPFQPLFVSWGGRSELKTLYSAETGNRAGSNLNGDQIYLGMYLNELLFRLLHKEEAHAQIFDDYQHCLELLTDKADEEVVLRFFELHLLEELGYAVNLETEYATGMAIAAEKSYAYVPEHGFIYRETLHNDEIVIHGQTILALSQQKSLDGQQKKEAKLLLRSIIEYHLDGQPLKTRELFYQKTRFYQPG